MSQLKRIYQSHQLFSALLLGLGLIATVYSFASAPQITGQESEDPFNQIHEARFEEGNVTRTFSGELPDDAFTTHVFERKQVDDAVPERPAEKIHPLLKARLERGAAAETEEVIITFRDDLKIPRFPQPMVAEPRDSATNQRALSRATELVAGIQRQRNEGYQTFVRSMSQVSGFELRQTYWLIKGLAARMPMTTIRELADREDVLYIEPANSGAKPPQDGNANNDIADGRARMMTDPYFNLGLTGSFIGLLDTGLRFSHTLYNTPSQISRRYDCVNGGGSCIQSGRNYNPNDDCWNHGTSTGSIITGNGNLGDAYRGVTAITLDSYKVYPNSCGGLSEAATLAAFQTAVSALDRVIVAEMQGGGSDTSAISVAADNAFDAGSVIIAANGNNGPGASTVNTPAIAHKVIGVGVVDVVTGVGASDPSLNYQSRGPAPDGRVKPDILAPTNAEAASSASDTALQVFGGTSGATPFAAGAAALLRNYLINTFSIPLNDPGQVYAALILSGQKPGPFDNISGAGVLRLPTNGTVWVGKTTVSPGGTVNIPLTLTAGFQFFDGALWWPETATGGHNDIDLSLIDPAGTARASSASSLSVFERARAAGPLAGGTWTLRIRGFSGTGAQTVYWAAHQRQ
jgi:hypothetical protein